MFSKGQSIQLALKESHQPLCNQQCFRGKSYLSLYCPKLATGAAVTGGLGRGFALIPHHSSCRWGPDFDPDIWDPYAPGLGSLLQENAASRNSPGSFYGIIFLYFFPACPLPNFLFFINKDESKCELETIRHGKSQK